MNRIYVDYEDLGIALSYNGRNAWFGYKTNGLNKSSSPVDLVKWLSEIMYYYVLNGEDEAAWHSDVNKPALCVGIGDTPRQQFKVATWTTQKLRYLLSYDADEFPFWPEEKFQSIVTQA